MHSLLPVGREFLCSLVVSSQPMHSALNKNEAELGVLVLSVAFQMLAHSHSLLDQMVQIFGDLRAQSCEGEGSSRDGSYKVRQGKGREYDYREGQLCPSRSGIAKKISTGRNNGPTWHTCIREDVVLNITDMFSKVLCGSLNHSQKLKRWKGSAGRDLPDLSPDHSLSALKLTLVVYRKDMT